MPAYPKRIDLSPSSEPEAEAKISQTIRRGKMTHFQCATFLQEEFKKISPNKLSLKKAFEGSRFILDRKLTLFLTHPGQLFISPKNPNFFDNVLELFDRQIDDNNIAYAYSCLRANLSAKVLFPSLQNLAKNSRNVLVWNFLTSVMEWNIGTQSLRFLIKEQNSMYDQESHQKYLFHTNNAFVSEDELLKDIREAN